jgi:hypothetical protein
MNKSLGHLNIVIFGLMCLPGVLFIKTLDLEAAPTLIILTVFFYTVCLLLSKLPFNQQYQYGISGREFGVITTILLSILVLIPYFPAFPYWNSAILGEILLLSFLISLKRIYIPESLKH